jgi:hypothetical protein
MAEVMGFDYGPPLKAPVPYKPMRTGDHDPILANLMRLGMVHGARAGASGFMPIECPWEDQHQTPPIEQGAGYIPAVGGGAFHCFHSSCRDKTTKDLRRWAQVASTKKGA